MQLFPFLQILDSKLTPGQCKLHLACWNGREHPRDVYVDGRFEEWQHWQTNKNFERDYVVSLIQLPQNNKWLFAGAYESHGYKTKAAKGRNKLPSDKKVLRYIYNLKKRRQTNQLDGRLIVDFKRPGRNSYLNCEKWTHLLKISEIRPDKLRVAEFPGYSWTMISKQHLNIIVKQNIESWKSALTSVSGIYVISDRKSGKLYIGSATGRGGIWSRWQAYATTGHGGNRDLKKLLKLHGADYAQHFQFGVIEIADTHASENDIIARESYWKELLLTRVHGHNAN